MHNSSGEWVTAMWMRAKAGFFLSVLADSFTWKGKILGILSALGGRGGERGEDNKLSSQFSLSTVLCVGALAWLCVWCSGESENQLWPEREYAKADSFMTSWRGQRVHQRPYSWCRAQKLKRNPTENNCVSPSPFSLAGILINKVI